MRHESGRPFDVQRLHNFLELGVAAKSGDLGLDLALQVIHDPEGVVERLCVIAQVVYRVLLERRRRRTLL